MSGSLNSLRGAVPFTADGADYYLRLTTNAQIRYEDAAGETGQETLARMQPPPRAEGDPEPPPEEVMAWDRGLRRRIRRMFAAGLSHMEGMTEEAAGDLIDAVGFHAAMSLVMNAWVLSLPEPVEGNAPRAAKAAPTKTKPAPASGS